MISLLLAAVLAAAPVTQPAAAPQVSAVDTLDVAAALRTDGNLLLIDLREAEAFADGHLPVAVNYPWGEAQAARSLERLRGMFKLGPRQVILYGAEPLTLSAAAEAVAALNAGRTGVYPGGTAGWVEAGGFLEIEWAGLWRLLTRDVPQVFDVRGAGDFAAGHVAGALRFEPELAAEPPAAFVERVHKAGRPVVTYCGGGLCGESRKLAAALAKRGVARVYQFAGGYPEWAERTEALR